MDILHLTLKKKWFDMIKSGEKPEEYREIKPYWLVRLFALDRGALPENFYPDEVCSELKKSPEIYQKILKWAGIHPRTFDAIIAKNGYSGGAPLVSWKHKGIRIGKPRPDWCEPGDEDKTVFILEIGELL